MVFFFFRAEDGIRDYKVTGVQTCALPIFNYSPRRIAFLLGLILSFEGQVAQDERDAARRVVDGDAPAQLFEARLQLRKIGRASCRERVGMSEGGGNGERKRER